jgi:hypothetical protein
MLKGTEPIIKVGTRYRVEIDDCCVEGVFTAAITQIVRRLENDDLLHVVETTDMDSVDQINFDNGVIFTNCDALKFAEVIA